MIFYIVRATFSFILCPRRFPTPGHDHAGKAFPRCDYNLCSLLRARDNHTIFLEQVLLFDYIFEL